jgi:hypothetical protein
MDNTPVGGDTAIGLRTASVGLDTSKIFAGIDPGKVVRDALLGVDASKIFAGIDPGKVIRDAIASFDPATSLREVLTTFDALRAISPVDGAADVEWTDLSLTGSLSVEQVVRVMVFIPLLALFFVALFSERERVFQTFEFVGAMLALNEISKLVSRPFRRSR